MMVLQYFLYQRGDKAWIKLLVGYLCVSYFLPCANDQADSVEHELGHHRLLSVYPAA